MAAQQKEIPLQTAEVLGLHFFFKQVWTADGNLKILFEKEPPNFDY